MPEIALAKVDPRPRSTSVCTLACGATTGLGAALYIAKVEPGSTCAVLRRRAGRASGGGRLPAGRRRADHRRGPVRGPARARPQAQGATDTLVGGPDTVEQILEMTGGFGADYTFEATGNVAVMRQAVESARMGWGLCTVAGVAGKGEVLEIVPRFLITGRRAGRHPRLAARRDATACRSWFDLYMKGDLDLESLVTPA